jgi:hypothetical protein
MDWIVLKINYHLPGFKSIPAFFFLLSVKRFEGRD